jgi:DNA repair protein RecO (recombination protein O)
MLKTVEGIITRTVKYGDSSMILDLLTPDRGIQSFIIGGIRTKGKRNRSSLVQVLNLVTIEAYVKDSGQLSRIKEISYSYIYKAIPFDIVKSSIATFIIEVSRKALKSSDDSHHAYHYVMKGLIHLDNAQTDIAHFHIRFLIGMTRLLGFAINDNYSPSHPYFNLKDGAFQFTREDHRLSLDEDHSRYLHMYLNHTDYNQIPRADRREILNRLVDFYKFHIEDFGNLKSLDILQSLYD